MALSTPLDAWSQFFAQPINNLKLLSLTTSHRMIQLKLFVLGQKEDLVWQSMEKINLSEAQKAATN